MRAYKQPQKTIPRVRGHHRDWIDACKGGDPATSNFDYAGSFTELVLLDNVALRTGKKIYWDGPNLKATNALARGTEYVATGKVTLGIPRFFPGKEKAVVIAPDKLEWPGLSTSKPQNR